MRPQNAFASDNVACFFFQLNMFMGSDGGLLGAGGPEVVRFTVLLFVALRLSSFSRIDLLSRRLVR